jgi:hypothetical protein
MDPAAIDVRDVQKPWDPFVVASFHDTLRT